MKKYRAIRAIAFMLVVILLLAFLSDLFKNTNKRHVFRQQEYDSLAAGTVDGLYIGTSGVDRYWIAGKAYEEYGMTVYPSSYDALPMWLYINVLEYDLQKQDPELIIVDIRGFLHVPEEDSQIFDVNSRHVIDARDFFSASRMDAIWQTVKAEQAFTGSSLFQPDYLFSFLRFHSKWEDKGFSFDELNPRMLDTLGFSRIRQSTATVKKVEYPKSQTKKAELPEINEQYLIQLCDRLQALGKDVLFVSSPRVMNSTEQKAANRIGQVVEEYGYTYLDFNVGELVEKAQLDGNTDFYNDSHVNFFGAEKYTAYLAMYIDTHYDLPDRRGDPVTDEKWIGVYDGLKAYVDEVLAEKEKK